MKTLTVDDLREQMAREHNPQPWKLHVGALLTTLGAHEPLELWFLRYDVRLVYRQGTDGVNRIEIYLEPASGPPDATLAAANARILRGLTAVCGPLDYAVDHSSGTFRFHAPCGQMASWSYVGEAPPDAG